MCSLGLHASTLESYVAVCRIEHYLIKCGAWLPAPAPDHWACRPPVGRALGHALSGRTETPYRSSSLSLKTVTINEETAMRPPLAECLL